MRLPLRSLRRGTSFPAGGTNRIRGSAHPRGYPAR